MDLNNPVADEDDEEETLGPNIWSKDEEVEDEDEAETIFFLFLFLSMPKLCRWKCMFLFLEDVLKERA